MYADPKKINASTACFNTASGRYYCNIRMYLGETENKYEVSIPQAVGTIAILSGLVYR